MTNIIRISDEKILVELQKGNQWAFEQLFKRYYVLLCYEAKEYISEKYIIEELVGDVYRRLWENRQTLQINSSIRYYLIRSVHNACMSYLRIRQFEKVDVDCVTEENTLSSLCESPLDYILSKELVEHIDKAIDRLPKQYKRAFILSRYEDKSYNEIADEMSISVNAVKLYLKKALSKLRDDLKVYL